MGLELECVLARLYAQIRCMKNENEWSADRSKELIMDVLTQTEERKNTFTSDFCRENSITEA